MKYVTAAILVHDGLVLITKRKSGDRLADKWEFPGGTIEQGETAEQCLKREMKEEFSVIVSISQFLGDSVYDYEHGTIRLMAYRTFWKGGEITAKAHDDFRWVALDELDSYEFAPADIPFVEMLKNVKMRV